MSTELGGWWEPKDKPKQAWPTRPNAWDEYARTKAHAGGNVNHAGRSLWDSTCRGKLWVDNQARCQRLKQQAEMQWLKSWDLAGPIEIDARAARVLRIQADSLVGVCLQEQQVQ